MYHGECNGGIGTRFTETNCIFLFDPHSQTFGQGAEAAAGGDGSVSGVTALQSRKGKIGEMKVETSHDQALAALSHGLDSNRPSLRGNTLATREAILTTSLGPGPATYLSEAHGVEFELQAGSLDEKLPVEMTITQRLAFVECHAEGLGR